MRILLQLSIYIIIMESAVSRPLQLMNFHIRIFPNCTIFFNFIIIIIIFILGDYIQVLWILS